MLGGWGMMAPRRFFGMQRGRGRAVAEEQETGCGAQAPAAEAQAAADEGLRVDGADVAGEVTCGVEGVDADALREAAAEALEVIRFESRDSRLAQAETFAQFGLVPEGVDPEAFAAALAGVLAGAHGEGGDEDAAAPAGPLGAAVGVALAGVPSGDIRVLHGSTGPLFYSVDFMTDAYANWSYLAGEGDDSETFAYCVREESRVYPRPMKATSLENPPFHLPEARLAEVFAALQGVEAFADLRTTAASNGDVYYYSSEYLSDRYARSLAEWYSVERWESY